MFRALFVAEDVTLAHVARPLALAQGLGADRFQVMFAAGDRYRAFVEAAGFPVTRIATIPPEAFARRLARGQPVYQRHELEAYVREELALLEGWRPDLVVGDFRLSLGISADVARVPYVAIANAYWSPYSTDAFPMPEHWIIRLLGVRLATCGLRTVLPFVFRYHARPFNAVRRAHGLPPVGVLKHVYTHGTWTVYPDLPRLAATADLPPRHRYIGPVLWEPPMATPEWWDRVPSDLALVYVSLGSSGGPGLLEIVLEALRPLPVTVMAASVGADVRADGRTFAAPYLPGLQAAARARVVIGNGGSPVNYQALSRGVPVLGLPSNADQYLAIQAVEREGAGLMVRAGRARPAQVRAAVRALLEEPSYAERARALAHEMAAFDAPGRFADLLEEVLREPANR